MQEKQTEPESFIKPKEIKKVAEKPYNSNPFTLAFDAFGRFFESNKNWAIFLIVIGLIGFVFQGISTIADIASNGSSSGNTEAGANLATSNPDTAVIIAIVIVVVGIVLVVGTVAAVINTYIKGMLVYVALQSEEGKTVSLSEAFQATSQRFWRLLWAVVFSWVKIFAWGLLFIIPGIVAAFRYMLLPYVVMSQSADEKSIGSAHTATKRIVKGRLLEVFGVNVVGSIIPIIGSIIGLAGHAAQFNQLNVADKDNLEKPPVHWLNKLLLGLSIAVILFVIAIAVVFIAFIASDYKG